MCKDNLPFSLHRVLSSWLRGDVIRLWCLDFYLIYKPLSERKWFSMISVAEITMVSGVC